MLKIILLSLLPLSLFFGSNSDKPVPRSVSAARQGDTGTLEKMIASTGSVVMDLDLNRLNGIGPGTRAPKLTKLHFDVETGSFFTVIVFSGELRGPLPSSMPLVVRDSEGGLPGRLDTSYRQMAVESLPWGGDYDLVVRDAKTGLLLFNIDGSEFRYDAGEHLLNIGSGRLLMSKELAAELGRPRDAGSIVGSISITATMQAIEVTELVDGDVKSSVMPALNSPNAGNIPGPDVIVGQLSNLSQFGVERNASRPCRRDRFVQFWDRAAELVSNSK